jgi:hypothetical protein
MLGLHRSVAQVECLPLRQRQESVRGSIDNTVVGLGIAMSTVRVRDRTPVVSEFKALFVHCFGERFFLVSAESNTTYFDVRYERQI